MTPHSSKTLVYAPNWLGDAVMAMPAVAALRQAIDAGPLVVLCKPFLAPLWSSCGFVDDVVVLDPGSSGVWRTARRLRDLDFTQAYVVPHSFRSALVTFLARIPRRVGTAGHQRAWLLTDVVDAPGGLDSEHQSAEVSSLLGVGGQDLAMPELDLPAEALDACRAKLGGLADATPRVAVVPGAARGPSKQWPQEHFIAAGKLVVERLGGACLVLGSAAERELCRAAADGIGDRAVSLAGDTSLIEFAACLRLCDAAITNDSGGMHLAAAAGTRVVAVYGITDPGRTGPLGPGHHVLQDSDIRSRDVPRESGLATERLARITPEMVFEAVSAIVT